MIEQAWFPRDAQVVGALFREYAGTIPHDLCFQRFDYELAHLGEVYGPAGGGVLLAREGAELAGCVAVRPQAGDACEMKRLFVRSAWRGTGLGRRLAEAIIAQAREFGYVRMRLDTLDTMTPARTLYASLGFREVEAYYDNPIPGAVYYELVL